MEVRSDKQFTRSLLFDVWKHHRQSRAFHVPIGNVAPSQGYEAEAATEAVKPPQLSIHFQGQMAVGIVHMRYVMLKHIPFRSPSSPII